MLVAVIGQGYVGLPLSMAVASAGHTVLAVESDPERHAELSEGRSYIVNVDSADLGRAVDDGRLAPVRDLSAVPPADVYLVAVPTPVTADREPDLGPVFGAMRTLAESIRPGALLVVESTLQLGGLRDRVRPYLASLVGDDVAGRIKMAYSPQRIDPGRNLDYRDIPKLIAGLDPAATTAATQFYNTVFKDVVPVSSPEVAEFAKLLENTYRFVNVAFVNEMAKLAHTIGVDFRQVIDAAASKPFGFMPFYPGPGVGGHCLPNNVHYLRQGWRDGGGTSDVLTAAIHVNDGMPAYTVRRLEKALERRGSGLAGARVLLLGLSYKADVADARHSPAYAVSSEIVARGGQVRLADPLDPPHAGPESFVRVELTRRECEEADAVVLLTDHEGVDYEMVIESSRLVLDCRGRLRGERVEQL
ncbi:nucleotide sugar dehydrogenase [Streptomyces marincola]|nr:nucleotide sugar dehydrogenase [Streptomyces marincola]